MKAEHAKKVKELGIDKDSIHYLKYRDIALEFIKQGYTNIRVIYKKHYPDVCDETLDTSPYQLLDNPRFKMALEEAFTMLKPEDLDLGNKALLKLYDLMQHAKDQSVQLNAAIWLGKSDARFTDKIKDVSDISKDNIPERRGKAIDLLKRIAGVN